MNFGSYLTFESTNLKNQKFLGFYLMKVLTFDRSVTQLRGFFVYVFLCLHWVNLPPYKKS